METETHSIALELTDKQAHALHALCRRTGTGDVSELVGSLLVREASQLVPETVLVRPVGVDEDGDMVASVWYLGLTVGQVVYDADAHDLHWLSSLGGCVLPDDDQLLGQLRTEAGAM